MNLCKLLYCQGVKKKGKNQEDKWGQVSASTILGGEALSPYVDVRAAGTLRLLPRLTAVLRVMYGNLKY